MSLRMRSKGRRGSGGICGVLYFGERFLFLHCMAGTARLASFFSPCVF